MPTLEDLVKLQGSPAVAKDISRDTLPQFLTNQGYKVGAEIGVYKGEYTRLFCEAGLKMYAIDPWMAFPGQGRTQQIQERQDFLYGHAQRVLAPYPDCRIIRKTSMQALEDFKDGSLDFVYIDGDHSFPHVAQDVFYWEKKVRSGGAVCGHDYFDTAPTARNVVCNVKAVVDAFTKAFGIDNWWVFGDLNPETETRRKERYLSWMWIKA